MARPKGIPKTGGRKPGTPNRINASAIALMDQFGFDPLKGMMVIAVDKEVELAIRARMFSELAKYAYSQRRAIDVRVVDEDGKDRPFSLSDARALADG